MVFMVFLLLTCGYGYTQISPKFYGKPEDFKAMSKRTLVVELLEEDKDYVAKLSKKEKNAKELQEYQDFISEYNKMIKEVVPKYWKYNAVIEYKTESEVRKLRDAKNNKYVVLAYFELEDGGANVVTRSGLTVPALMYQRMEEPLRKIDYKIYFPSSFARKNSKYLESDCKFVLICMQEHIKWIIKNDDVLHFEDYTEKIAEPNCVKLKDYTVLIDKEYIDKSTNESEAKTTYGKKIEFVTAENLDLSYVNGEKGKAVLFAIPYGIAKGGIGPISSAKLMYLKVIVSCETGEILWKYKPGMGGNILSKLIKAEFKRMAECKL